VSSDSMTRLAVALEGLHQAVKDQKEDIKELKADVKETRDRVQTQHKEPCPSLKVLSTKIHTTWAALVTGCSIAIWWIKNYG
jgi:predicted negative regulator of RcsB-dependent stress response